MNDSRSILIKRLIPNIYHRSINLNKVTNYIDKYERRKYISAIRVLELPYIGLWQRLFGIRYYLIIDGHHRVEALKELGEYSVPCEIINSEIYKHYNSRIYE